MKLDVQNHAAAASKYPRLDCRYGYDCEPIFTPTSSLPHLKVLTACRLTQPVKETFETCDDSHRSEAMQRRNFQVAFKMPPSYSRPAKEDEISVMECFCRHLSRCKHCDYARFFGREILRGSGLCERAVEYALDVTAYVHCYRGAVYSSFERTTSRGPLTRVEVPHRYSPVHRLLSAVESGMVLKKVQRGISDDAMGKGEHCEEYRGAGSENPAGRTSTVIRSTRPVTLILPHGGHIMIVH